MVGGGGGAENGVETGACKQEKRGTWKIDKTWNNRKENGVERAAYWINLPPHFLAEL